MTKAYAIGGIALGFFLSAFMCAVFFFLGAAAQQQYNLAKVSCEVLAK